MTKSLNLTVLQYDAIMQAINNYKDELATNGLPMSWLAEYEPTADDVRKALEEVENKLIDSQIPF